MIYQLDFSKQAINDIDFHKKSGNRVVLKKIFVLLNELSEHPYTGTGKPELLKYDLAGYWSRRISREHRIIYEVLEDTVRIYSVQGHYE